MKNRKPVAFAGGLMAVMGVLLWWLSGTQAEQQFSAVVNATKSDTVTAPPRYRTPIPRPDGLSPRAKQEALKAVMQNLKAAQQAPKADANKQGEGYLDIAFEPAGVLSEKAVNAVIRAQLKDLGKCNQDWADAEAQKQAQGVVGALLNAEGRMVMGIHLDDQGVDFVEVLDVEVVPEFVLGCFSDFIYDADWPATNEPVLIEYPFVLEIVSEA